MISYEIRQDDDITFATFTREGKYFEVPIKAGQTEDKIQVSLEKAFYTYNLLLAYKK